MIDWARVEELRNDLGADGFDEVVELFLEEMDDRMLSMATSGAQTRAEDLHFFKGCAANLGFSQVQDLCAKAETDEMIEMDAIKECYDISKTAFAGGEGEPQIKTPDNTSSSVMSR